VLHAVLPSRCCLHAFLFTSMTVTPCLPACLPACSINCLHACCRSPASPHACPSLCLPTHPSACLPCLPAHSFCPPACPPPCLPTHLPTPAACPAHPPPLPACLPAHPTHLLQRPGLTGLKWPSWQPGMASTCWLLATEGSQQRSTCVSARQPLRSTAQEAHRMQDVGV
jgi:hypothetical protein